uniref:Uncharacterized protein n=1 Tax=Compsopogon caeruleus TaxID=31354 RepID=A0A7S1XGE2_9RHOD|mmetsp:Transcript_6045/g.11858  ORF Transcript_6045/g.11858 Transcript_6045/m.11858 type:complete len:315 (+) Transcript_6045:206-1150(+)
MAWWRRRQGAEDAARQLEDLERDLMSIRRNLEAQRRSRSYVRQTVSLYGSLSVVVVAGLVYFSGGPTDVLAPGTIVLSKLVILGLSVLAVIALRHVVDLIYDRSATRLQSKMEGIRETKKAILDTLKNRTKFDETMRVLQRFDDSTATPESNRRTEQEYMRMAGEGGHAIPPRGVGAPGSPFSELGSRIDAPQFRPLNFEDGSFEHGRPGSAVLSRIVDLLAGDAADSHAQDVSREEMEELQRALALERARRIAVEVENAEMRQRLSAMGVEETQTLPNTEGTGDETDVAVPSTPPMSRPTMEGEKRAASDTDL